MQNMGDTLLQNARRYCPSETLNFSSWICRVINLAPTGYPHKKPQRIQKEPFLLQWNRKLKTLPNIFSIYSIRGVFKISCETIKKGRSVGRSTSNQSKRPLFEASRVWTGSIRRKRNKIMTVKRGIIFFKGLPVSEICTSYVSKR